MPTKHLSIKKLSATPAEAKDVAALFDSLHLDYSEPLFPNWGDVYPYVPEAQFRIAYSDDALVHNYRVKENAIRAVAETDNGHVWEDSCFEFFFSPFDDGLYYNFECNCAARLLIGCGSGRDGRQLASPELVGTVKRWSSNGNEPFDTTIVGDSFIWNMSLIVPFKAFFKHDIKSLNGIVAKGNFYKCGDKLPQPHFLSWSPVRVEKPDFHRPEFFGELLFNL